MLSHKINLKILFLLIVFLSACTPTPQAVPPTTTPQPAPTSSEIPAPTATPLPPVLMVGGDVPCYAGPGTDYEILATVSIGMKMEVMSRDEVGEYWIVKTPARDGMCWIESRYATIVGSSAGIPPLATDAVPTRAIKLPEAPKNLHSTFTCSPILVNDGSGRGHASGRSKVAVNLNWPDVLTGTGYRIFKNGLLLKELPANTLEFVDYFEISKGFSSNFTYKIEAFNQDGVSSSPEVEVFINYFGCK